MQQRTLLPGVDGCAGSEDVIEDPDEGQEEARAALNAAKRSRKNGTLSDAAIVDAMEAAEAKHGAREARSKAEVHYTTLHMLSGQTRQSFKAVPEFLSKYAEVWHAVEVLTVILQ